MSRNNQFSCRIYPHDMIRQKSTPTLAFSWILISIGIVTCIPQEWRDYDCSFIITRLKFTDPDPFDLLRHDLPKIPSLRILSPFNAFYVNCYNYICARARAVRSREQLCLFARSIECCLPNRSLERLNWITFPVEALNVKHLTGF